MNTTRPSAPDPSQPRDDVPRALGLGHGPRQGGNDDVKYTGPDCIMVDLSETGWVGTTGNM